MEERILVDRHDGPAVAGLVTGLLAHWDHLPLRLQSAILEHAGRVAVDTLGHSDGRYRVAAFVVKYRAAMARRDRSRGTFGFRVRETIAALAAQRRRLREVATRWPLAHWFGLSRRAA